MQPIKLYLTMSNGAEQQILSQYRKIGNERFYRYLLVQATKKMLSLEKEEQVNMAPDLELLNFHDQFMIFYRRTGYTDLLEIARLFRKAGHKIYRIMRKRGITPVNRKFLNLVFKCQ